MAFWNFENTIEAISVIDSVSQYSGLNRCKLRELDKWSNFLNGSLDPDLYRNQSRVKMP